MAKSRLPRQSKKRINSSYTPAPYASHKLRQQAR